MKNETKIFLIIFILIIVVVVSYRYQQYFLNKNFILSVHTSCDSKTEKCFASDCVLGEDPECDESAYKKVEILDSIAPVCLEEHNCPTFFCEQVVGQCSIIYCSEENLDDGEKCLDITQ
ncbi:MAG: hypothetical protein WCF94_01080 [bacterium]